MPRIVPLAVAMTVTAWAPSGPLRAQERIPGVSEGDRIRVTWCDEFAGRCELRHRISGTLIARDSAGLHIARRYDSLQVAWSAVRRIEAHGGTRGALRTVLFGAGGLVLGGFAGMLAGALLQGECSDLECLAGPAYGIVIGAPAGLVGGVWWATATRDRWSPVFEASGRAAAERRVLVGVALPWGW